MEISRGNSSGIELDQNSNEEDDDACSISSNTSNLSGFSNLSTISGKDWKPCAGQFFVHQKAKGSPS